MRAALARAGAFVRRHQIAHRARLVGQLGRDERALRRVGDAAEHRVVTRRCDHVVVGVALPRHQRAAIVAHGNARRHAAALGHENQVDPLRTESLRGVENAGQRVVRLAVGEDHQYAIGELGARLQQLRALHQRGREVGAAGGRDVGIHGVEVQGQRGAVDCERRQDVAGAGERDEPDAVAVEILDQAVRFALRAPQPARRHVLGQHRARDVHRDHQVEAARLRHDLVLAPTRAGERHHPQEHRDAHRRGTPAARGAGGALGLGRPAGGPLEPGVARPRGGEPPRTADDRRDQEDHRRVEAHQGTRITSVAETTISSARASRPTARGQRYHSSKRR